ncbi:hypothetical protein BV25DRAFT_1832615 [Artomyces pyxidatus]|uniref:Uncharacterized protein n=1 Tax=Artomyces pyxidatus TaxID=48021 RepID=A0ACB8SHZ1_9AGAM|nr:hypothetical protein BV25DRAFT_1832615 [Artomyces pyxidatus]
MAPPTRTPSNPAISRPFPLQRKLQPTPASVTRATVTATGSLKLDSDSQVESLTRIKHATLSRTRTTSRPSVLRPAPPPPASSTRKRTRRDSTSDDVENEAVDSRSQETGRAPRVRQRLSSMSSMETIRAGRSGADQALARATLSRQTSRASVRDDAAPPEISAITSANVAQAAAPTLRRVGTVPFNKTPKGHAENDISSKYPSRIPLPSRHTSMTVAAESEGTARARLSHPDRLSSSCSPSRRASGDNSISYPSTSLAAAAATSSISSRASLDRFDLKLAMMKKHTELWDLPDESVYAWEGILVFTDLAPSSSAHPAPFPIQSVDIQCHTLAYEGRFSLETNALPSYSTCFAGVCVSKKDMPSLVQNFDPGTGIVLQKEWHQAELKEATQWHVKFRVPVPMDLCRKKETQMFRLKAQVSAVDDRTGRLVNASSGTVVADISHLRKLRDMDRKAAL